MCETLGDLFPNEEFLSLEDAQDRFNLRQGQFLQYASMAAIVKEIWTSYPAAPGGTNTLGGAAEMGVGGKTSDHIVLQSHDQ